MPSYGQRLKYAFRTFFSILDHSRIPDDVLETLVKKEAAPAGAAPPAVEASPPAPDAPDRALQMLAILQRDGRLIDFLMEDLAPYPDAQVGAAVRDIHAGCRQAIERYFSLQPVIDDEEGRPVTVERPDPASIKVVGNVTGSSPVRGVLRHRGWEAIRVELPPLPATGRTVVAPAEVEIA
jgi:hypothetical protein